MTDFEATRIPFDPKDAIDLLERAKLAVLNNTGIVVAAINTEPGIRDGCLAVAELIVVVPKEREQNGVDFIWHLIYQFARMYPEVVGRAAILGTMDAAKDTNQTPGTGGSEH